MITLNIKNAVKLKQTELSIFINVADTHCYEQVAECMRTFEMRHLDRQTNTWELAHIYLEQIIDMLNKHELHITYTKPANDIALDKFVYKTQPRAYQTDGVKFGLKVDNFILGDEPGLGKSKQLIDTAVIKKQLGLVKQCLIICGISTLKYNWLNEIKIHSNESAWVLGTTVKNGKVSNDKGVKARIEDLKTRKEFFLITNIETLRNDKFTQELCKHPDINMIALDEAHVVRNTTTEQGKAFQKLQDFDYKVAMTGTPIINNPLDAYAILRWLEVEGSNPKTFKNFYCVLGGVGNTEVLGYRNLHKLREKISSVMIRRLKKDVLPDLPPKIETAEYIEMGAKQLAIYKEVRTELLNEIDLIAISQNPLAKLIRLRQATAHTSILSSTVDESCKFDRLEQIVSELVANDRKCVVFSNWTSVTKPLFEKFKKYNPALITGEVTTKERQIQVEKLQTDSSCKMLIGTIAAAGTGITLTAADTVVFMDLPWNRAVFDQACDRIHRIGAKSTANIIKLICPNTIDEAIDNIMYKKGKTADLLVDGIVTTRDKKNLLLQLL